MLSEDFGELKLLDEEYFKKYNEFEEKVKGVVSRITGVAKEVFTVDTELQNDEIIINTEAPLSRDKIIEIQEELGASNSEIRSEENKSRITFEFD